MQAPQAMYFANRITPKRRSPSDPFMYDDYYDDGYYG
jgi:hypothetical protein